MSCARAWPGPNTGKYPWSKKRGFLGWRSLTILSNALYLLWPGSDYDHIFTQQQMQLKPLSYPGPWQDSLSMITDIVPIHSWSLDKRTLLKDWILRTKIASLHIWWCENCNYYLWLQYAVLHISCLPSLISISISNELDRPGLHCIFPLSRRAATPKLKYHGSFTIALVHQYNAGLKVNLRSLTI